MPTSIFTFEHKGSSISSRTHFKGWKRDFLFLTLQKQAKKQHFLPFHPCLALFWKRDEPNYAYYSHFSLRIFKRNVVFCIVQSILIFKKVFRFSKILDFIWKRIQQRIYEYDVYIFHNYIEWYLSAFLKTHKWANGVLQRSERVHQTGPLLFESKSHRAKLQQ